MTSMVATADRIQEKATEFQPIKMLLTLLALPFFVVGWVAYTVYRVVRLVASWLWAAVMVGWETAQPSKADRSP